jgi:hypothetical protein
MRIKKKHILVVVFSSVIITVVLVSTLVGYSLYIQWKEDSFAAKYRNSIYKLTAEMLRKDITIANTSVRIGKDEPFSGMPVLEGSIKNNSPKTITSMMIELSFFRPDGSVVYKDWFYPLKEKQVSQPVSFSGAERTRNVLLPGEGMTFRHLLRSCPHALVTQIAMDEEFAKTGSENDIKLEYSITGLSVL